MRNRVNGSREDLAVADFPKGSKTKTRGLGGGRRKDRGVPPRYYYGKKAVTIEEPVSERGTATDWSRCKFQKGEKKRTRVQVDILAPARYEEGTVGGLGGTDGCSRRETGGPPVSDSTMRKKEEEERLG